MSTLHFNNLDIIQSSVETIYQNMGSVVARRDLIGYGKEHPGNSVLPSIHMKSIEKYRVTAVCINNINVFINSLLCLYAV